jgi:hypothetical protein
MFVGLGFVPKHVWAPCCGCPIKMKIWEEKKFCCKIFERKKMFGSRVTLLVGRHVVNELNVAGNVGCHVNERGLGLLGYYHLLTFILGTT